MSLWSRQKKRQSVLPDRQYSYPELCDAVRRMLNDYTGGQTLDIGLNEEMQKNQEEYRRMVSSCIRSCCSGNYGARETVRELIRSYLFQGLQLREEGIERIFSFSVPEKLPASAMLESLLYLKDKSAPDRGFQKLWETCGWHKETVITGQMVRNTYIEQNPQFTYEDKIHILSQCLFADTVGLGVIDSLNCQKGCIEEIQLGLNGHGAGSYNYKEDLAGKYENMLYGKDGIHIMVKGKNVWLQCLSFGTEEELQRVLRNLIKDAGAGELTRMNPMIVVETVDGRRVSVSRPPMTDTWTGLIRKFDTVEEISLDMLYGTGERERDLTALLRFLVRSGRNMAFTGEMAAGKTTLFRSCLKETGEEYNLRVIEAESFELNVRNFMPERNTMTMRITEELSAEQVLAFARKTTGQIFAVGEVNSASVAVMTMDLAKVATQMLFSAHYLTTEHMIADFVNAKLCEGGYSDEGLAEQEVIRSLGFDIHVKNRFGKRYVQYINEIVPEPDCQTGFQIVTVYACEEGADSGRILRDVSSLTYQRARETMTKEDYDSFSLFLRKRLEKEKKFEKDGILSKTETEV